jgi:hypothetical protein
MEATVVQTWHECETSGKAWAVRLLPSFTDFAFLFPLVVIFGFLNGSNVLFKDGDVGWHIRTGDWILAHRAVPRADLFSSTMSGRPWFAWEWGWDAAFSMIHRVGGMAAVAFFNVLLLCAASALLYRLIRRRCENDLVSLGMTGIAVLATSVHWHARPHLVAWLFVLVFCHAAADAEEGNRKLLWWLPVLTIFWANVHASFGVGIMVLVAAAAGAALESLAEHASWPLVYASATPYLLCALGCLAASFLNPYGWHLHAHIVGYLSDSELLDHIQEFQSPNFHPTAMIFFESLLLAGSAAALWCLQRRRYAAAILIAAWAHLSLASIRNAPLLVFFAAPWVAAMICDAASYGTDAPSAAGVIAGLRRIGDDLRPMERLPRLHFASALGAALLACGFLGHYPKFEAGFDARRFPEAALATLAAAHPRHLFTEDLWADYLIYKDPSTRVFFDTRSDFYGTKFMARYSDLLSAAPGWQTELQRDGIDAVLVRPDRPLAAVLKLMPGWSPVFTDRTAILFCAGPHAVKAPATKFTAEGSLQTRRSASKFITNKKGVVHA